MLTLQQAAHLQALVEAYSMAEYQAGFTNCRAYVMNDMTERAACAAASREANARREEMLSAFAAVTCFAPGIKA